MTTNKYLWVLPTLLMLTILLTACGVSQAQEEIEEPINLAQWPTPLPTAAPASPTPFPKVTLAPTTTPTPPLPTATPTPSPASQEFTSTGDLSTLTQQVTALGGLSPVAIVLVTADGATIRQGPGASYGAVSTVERSSLAGVLGKNSAGDWLYVVDTSLSSGWLPIDAVRVTGDLAEAPILPPDPLTALLTQAIASSSPASSSGNVASRGSSSQILTPADLEPVATARVNNDLLNVRQRPGPTFKLLDTLSRGEEVTVLALNRDKQWALVEIADEKWGWVSLDFLEVDGDLANAPQLRSLTPGQDYPSDQIAPITSLTGQVGEVPAGSSSTSSVTESSQSVLPERVLAPMATARVNRKVDLQRDANPTSGSVATLTVDESVSILASNEQKNWVVVQATNSRVGWVPLDSLAVEGSLADIPPVQTAWVESNELAIRRGPGIFHEVVGTLAINDLVAVLAASEEKNWVLIETLTGGRGWISPKFLAALGSLDDLPQASALSFPTELPPTDQPAPPSNLPRPDSPNLLALQLSSGGQIMLINADGSGLRRLTHGIDPVLSPDGQTVAFTRWDENEQGSLWTIKTDGTNERQVIGDLRKAKGPDWAPDSSQIIFNYQHGGRLDPKDVCYNLSKRKPPTPPFNAYNFKGKLKDGVPYFCWTLPPDPHWGLRVVDLVDNNSKDVDGGTYAFRPAWDPSQPWRIVADGGMGLLGVDLNRAEYRQNLTDNVYDGSPVFSPDGRYLAVTAGSQGGGPGHDIYRLNADGSGRLRLTQTPLWVTAGPDEQKAWNNVAPAWSPDGSQIAFLTNRTGRWEIWVMGADGSNQHSMFSDTVNDQLDITYNFVDERVLSWR
jgi:uncharacterized protein YgiM (DUF1202 family)